MKMQLKMFQCISLQLNPKYVSRDQVIHRELDMNVKFLTQQALNEGKPEKIVEKMVEGRISKFFEEICVIEQAFR